MPFDRQKRGRPSATQSPQHQINKPAPSGAPKRIKFHLNPNAGFKGSISKITLPVTPHDFNTLCWIQYWTHINNHADIIRVAIKTYVKALNKAGGANILSLPPNGPPTAWELNTIETLTTDKYHLGRAEAIRAALQVYTATLYLSGAPVPNYSQEDVDEAKATINAAIRSADTHLHRHIPPE